MADDKTTKTPGQPVTDTGPDKETPPAPQKEPEKVSVSPEPEKKTEPEVKNPQVSVYNFAEIMKEKKAEERAAAPGGEKPDPAKAEKPEKQPEVPKKAEEKPKEPEQPKRRGRPPKADKDKAAAPKPKAPAQKPGNAVKKEPEKKAAPPVQAAPAPKEPDKPKDAPRRGKEQIVYIKLNELHAFKNHPFEVRDDEEMRAMVSSVKDKGVTQPAIVRPREDGGYEIVSGHRRQKASELAGYADMPCIVRNLTDDEAITQMVEDNLNQREEILPSERAKALKMQLEAIKHQGSRTSGQIDPKDAGKRSNEIVAERNKMAVKQVQRYIRLNGITLFPQNFPYFLAVNINWKVKLYRLQRHFRFSTWIYLNFFNEVSDKTFLFLITHYSIQLSKILHDFVNIIKRDGFHLNRAFSQLRIFNAFLQLHHRIIQSIKP